MKWQFSMITANLQLTVFMGIIQLRNNPCFTKCPVLNAEQLDNCFWKYNLLLISSLHFFKGKNSQNIILLTLFGMGCRNLSIKYLKTCFNLNYLHRWSLVRKCVSSWFVWLFEMQFTFYNLTLKGWWSASALDFMKLL